MNQWSKTQLAGVDKSLWTEEEDERLRQVVKEYGTKHWTRISLIFNSSSLGLARTKKQCKEHWENTLNADSLK